MKKSARRARASGRMLTTSTGETVKLGKEITRGGAGSIYLIPKAPHQVAKIYHSNVDLALYERKIEAMLKLGPDLPELNENGVRITQIAWPQAVLHDNGQRFCGFTMPLLHLEDTIELEYMLQERQARAAGLPVGLGARITLAANVCALVAELHRQQHFVVDLKPINLRFYRQSLHLAMLDCDGFSINGGQVRYPAPQYTPDYLAPECHRHGLSADAEMAQDRFALAVIVFQLLNFGIHPFSGRPVGNHTPTDLPARIAGHYYAYGVAPHPRITPNPASGHAQFPSELRQLFDRAFGTTPAQRPSAGHWARVLAPYALKSSGRLVVCAKEPEHQHFAGKACAACARVALMARTASTAKAAHARGRPRTNARPTAMPARAQPAPQPPPPKPPQSARQPASATSSAPQQVTWWNLLIIAALIIVTIPLYYPLKFINRLLARWPMATISGIGVLIGAWLVPWLLSVDDVKPKPPVQASSPAPDAAPSLPPLAHGPSYVLNASQTESIETLLDEALFGDGDPFRTKFIRFLAVPWRAQSGNPDKAMEALEKYVDALAPETTFARDELSPTRVARLNALEIDPDEYLEQAAMAAPHLSYLLSEIGHLRLTRHVRFPPLEPNEHTERFLERTRSTYYAALSANPRDPYNWNALGIVFAAMENDEASAISAFAIAHYLENVSATDLRAAPPGMTSEPFGDWSLNVLFASSEAQAPETRALKTRASELRARGIALAEKLLATTPTRPSAKERSRYARSPAPAQTTPP